MPVIQSHNKITRFVKFWLPVLVWMALIFYSSSLPPKKIPFLFPFQDVIFHLAVYTFLAYFFARALKNTYSNLNRFRVVYLTIIFGVIYGITDEFHQIFVPGRYAQALDLFTDGVGSFLGSCFFQWQR